MVAWMICMSFFFYIIKQYKIIYAVVGCVGL